jgi:hypothetical protein
MEMKKLLIGFLLLLPSIAYAEDAADPRQCPAQLTAAEADGSNLLRSLHALGAQREIMQSDFLALKKENADLKKQLDELKK